METDKLIEAMARAVDNYMSRARGWRRLLVEVRQEDREAAAAMAVLPEMRELILAGRADHHAKRFAACREATEARTVAAIVAWLRGPALSAWGADCSGASETDYYANAIERGEWREPAR